MTSSLKIMISACELSADNYAGELTKALLKQDPSCNIFGVGSHACKKAGMDVRYDISGLSTVGIIEPIRFLPKLYQSLNHIKQLLNDEKPDIFIPIDNQGLHIECCKYAKKIGVKTAYYIAPQHWHWGKKSEGIKVASIVDHILAIFKQEAEFYKACGANVTYVGHPIIDRIRPFRDNTQKKSALAIFPGSRLQEIERLLPILIKASAILEKELHLNTIISIASPQYADMIKSLVKRYTTKPVSYHEGSSLELISMSCLSLVSSGTVSLEHALMGVPHVVTYKFNPITYWIASTFFKKTLAKIPFMSMPNMIANKEIFPELLQKNVTVTKCVKNAKKIYVNHTDKTQKDCELIWTHLNTGIVADLAATTLLSII
ncbi:lipid-A-disaccharide synthase [bacterium]|nr:lipid-A-disaccharide synthase [bacterium]|tara:strand:+ start:2455 stop:3576 length:1122 start_codon:yes stop_codon:yes gene_type:complete